MALETGTFVEDLVTTNPPGGDDKRQGDDHLRLIKTVLRNTLRRATKAFFLPGVVSKSANYTVLESDENLTIQCDTTSAFTLTLPALDGTRAGWTIYVVKVTTDANPVFLAPPSGTINGFTKVRRSAEFAITKVVWTGTVWLASRPFGAPVGSTVKFYGATLPNGYLWADGASFTAANFVELNSVFGTNSCPDVRGRDEVGRDNMGVGAASRITVAASGVNPTAVRNSGGTEVHTLTVAQLPASGVAFTTGVEAQTHTHSGSTGTESAFHSHAVIGDTGVNNSDHTHAEGTFAPGGNAAAGGQPFYGSAGSGTTGGASAPHTHSMSFTSGVEDTVHSHGFTSGVQSANHTHTGVTNNLGSGNAHLNLQPLIICNVIVMAE